MGWNCQRMDMVHSLVLPPHLVVPQRQLGAGMKDDRNRRPGEERPLMRNFAYGDRRMHMGIPVCKRARIAEKFAYGDPITHNEIVRIWGLTCKSHTCLCKPHSCLCKSHTFSHLLNFGKVTQATLASYTSKFTQHQSRESVRSCQSC
jgi:hypothetical protein